MAEQASICGIGELLQEVFAREDGPRRVLEFMANAAMREEVRAHLGAGPHERSQGRRGHRNGTKVRKLNTRVGEVGLDVPQVRGCDGGPYHPSMFARWQRSERALLVACAEMYFQGVSTRGVRDVLESMCGTGVSAATEQISARRRMVGGMTYSRRFTRALPKAAAGSRPFNIDLEPRSGEAVEELRFLS